MNMHRVALMFLLALLLFTLGASAQETIRWEKGRAICESNYEWDATAGGMLKVEVSALDVTAIGGPGDKITLTERIVLSVDDEKEAKKYYEMYRVGMEKSGSEFHFKSPETHRPFRGGSLVFQIPDSFKVQVSTSGGDLEVRNIKGKVDLATSGGDIDTRDIDGDVSIATSGGDISIHGIEGNLEAATSGGDIDAANCAPKIAIHTSGGDIELMHLSGSVDASTSGGDITLADLDGGANVSTSGGDIEITDIKGNGSVNAATSGGDVIAENIAADISLSTSSGDIELTAIKGSVDVSTSNGDISGSNVEGPVIKASTSSGDVHLNFVSGKLKIATSNGDLSLKMKKSGDSYEAELSTSDGDVVCTVPDDYKVSVDARILDWRKGSDNDIVSDFDLKIRTENSHTRVASGNINGGGPALQIETSHGDISIEKY